jgi:hypothetical protein
MISWRNEVGVLHGYRNQYWRAALLSEREWRCWTLVGQYTGGDNIPTIPSGGSMTRIYSASRGVNLNRNIYVQRIWPLQVLRTYVDSCYLHIYHCMVAAICNFVTRWTARDFRSARQGLHIAHTVSFIMTSSQGAFSIQWVEVWRERLMSSGLVRGVRLSVDWIFFVTSCYALPAYE